MKRGKARRNFHSVRQRIKPKNRQPEAKTAYIRKSNQNRVGGKRGTVLGIPERADFQFKRAEKAQAKADKLKGKAEKAQNKLPHKRKVKKQRVYDEKKKKAKTRLKFEKEIKPQSDIYHRSPVKNAADMAGMTVLNKAPFKSERNRTRKYRN